MNKTLTKSIGSSSSSDFLTVAEVKNYLKISQAAAYALTRREDFPISRFGGCIRIPKDAFALWVDKMTTIPDELSKEISAV